MTLALALGTLLLAAAPTTVAAPLASAAGVATTSPPACTVRCSCTPPAPPLAELARLDAVFLGTVVSVHETGPAATPDRPFPPGSLVATIEVASRWKGAAADTVEVHTSRGLGAACGFDFRVGHSYLVYAHDQGGALHTSTCLRTRLAVRAHDDLAALGPPR